VFLDFCPDFFVGEGQEAKRGFGGGASAGGLKHSKHN